MFGALSRPKGPSPLRSAGAVQNLASVRTIQERFPFNPGAPRHLRIITKPPCGGRVTSSFLSEGS
jgi:hypothetical protein